MPYQSAACASLDLWPRGGPKYDLCALEDGEGIIHSRKFPRGGSGVSGLELTDTSVTRYVLPHHKNSLLWIIYSSFPDDSDGNAHRDTR